MSANILTPLMLWKGFSVDSEPVIYSVLTKQKSDVVIDHFYINGRSTVSGVVRIYGVSAVPNLHQDAPVVIVFTDGRGLSEEKIATSIAKEGYRAFVINLYGKKQGKESYTIYPEDINYANFESSADNLYHVDKSVTKTCWYEWALAGRYAFNAIKERSVT